MILKPKIRIAQLIYSAQIGGSEICATDICTHLDKNIYDPIILFMYPGKGPMEEILNERGISFFHMNRNRLSRIFEPFTLAASLAKLNIDILHVHHIPLYINIKKAAKNCGIKHIVYTEHANYNIGKKLILQKACYDAALAVGRMTTVSNSLKKFFINSVGIKESLIQVIYNGVDIERFSPRPSNNELSKVLPEKFKGKKLITVGRLTEAKDYPNMFKALNLIKEQNYKFHLIIIGDGEMREIIENEIIQNNLNSEVTLAGRRTDIAELLSDADIFVLASKREGLPIAILEAMSSGLPIVATTVGAISEVLEDGYNAFMVEAENSVSLANGISKLLDDETLIDDYGRNSRKLVEEKYSMNFIVDQYAELYQQLIVR